MVVVMYSVNCIIASAIGIVVADADAVLSKENLLECMIFIVKYSTH